MWEINSEVNWLNSEETNYFEIVNIKKIFKQRHPSKGEGNVSIYYY